MDKTDSIEGTSAKNPKLEDNYGDHGPVEFVLQDAKALCTVDNDKQSITTDSDDRPNCSSVEVDEEPVLICILPDLVITEIFKKIPDQSTLLNCRLVCVKWNQFIKDSQLIARITFPVWDAKPFLDLLIVKQGKVKSISLKNCSLLEHKRKFIDLVSNSIEKVEFAFEDKLTRVMKSSQTLALFQLVFENCPKLQEITWKKGPLQLLPFLRSQVGIGKIRVATIYTQSTALYGWREDVNALIDFLSKLPKLNRIKLVICYRLVNARILRGLSEFIEKSASAHKFNLKELSLHATQVHIEDIVEVYQAFFQLLLLCGQHKIELEELPRINFNYLLSSANPTPKLSRSPIFQAKLNGNLRVEGPKLTNLDRLNGLNFGELNLVFKRDVINGELSWIKDVHAIESLILADDLKPKARKLGQPSNDEFEAVFSSGIPTLKKLDIISNGFSSIVFHWALYFPNVTTLSIDSCGNSSENLIVELTALECLTRLEFWYFPNLLDAAFTVDCVNRFPEAGGNSSMAPAITCLKSLKFLGLYRCPGLTDACVINGISKSKTLEKFQVTNCAGMSKKCKNFCEFEVHCENRTLKLSRGQTLTQAHTLTCTQTRFGIFGRRL